MSKLSLKRLTESQTAPAPKSVLDLSREGICPKTGKQMIKVKMTACKTPQMVWYSPESRVALPMENAEKL